MSYFRFQFAPSGVPGQHPFLKRLFLILADQNLLSELADTTTRRHRRRPVMSSGISWRNSKARSRWIVISIHLNVHLIFFQTAAAFSFSQNIFWKESKFSRAHSSQPVWIRIFQYSNVVYGIVFSYIASDFFFFFEGQCSFFMSVIGAAVTGYSKKHKSFTLWWLNTLLVWKHVD